MTELIWDGKYKDGKKQGPVRIALPFQTIETVNESVQERQRSLEIFAAGRETEWRNRLIWGDKKYVLASLLPEFAGKVNLIYIDPPFDTGADFSYTATIPDHPDSDEGEGTTFTKEPSILEQKAYRDTWGRGLDSYQQWFYETALLLHELLHESGSLYVHLDWHVAHYAKVILDEVFGSERFVSEIVWYYSNKYGANSAAFDSFHNIILLFSKAERFTYNPIFIPVKEARKQPLRKWNKELAKNEWQKDANGKYLYVDSTEKELADVWEVPVINPMAHERLGYATQKPETLLERVIKASSNEGDLVLDCFVGSGTTAAVAEKLNRRWIACDLGRFAIHTTRKRLLGIPNVRPFVVQNLGKYERQAWQAAEFSVATAAATDVILSEAKNPRSSQYRDSSSPSAPQNDRMDMERGREAAYRKFILELYHATPITGRTWLHGTKGSRMVHVGAVDAPITLADVKAIAKELWKAVGTAGILRSAQNDKRRAQNDKREAQDDKSNAEILRSAQNDRVETAVAPVTAAVDILGWEFAFEMNETAKQIAAESRVNVAFKKIPREVLDKKAIEQGDVQFFELAALSVDVKQKKREISLRLTDFVIPTDDIPVEVRKAIKHWSQMIDYWAVDWNYKGDTFHNQWQAYRTRREPKIPLDVNYLYSEPGKFQIEVKVIDILGNDTTKTLTVVV